jgi:hypothetical protein
MKLGSTSSPGRETCRASWLDVEFWMKLIHEDCSKCESGGIRVPTHQSQPPSFISGSKAGGSFRSPPLFNPRLHVPSSWRLICWSRSSWPLVLPGHRKYNVTTNSRTSNVAGGVVGRGNFRFEGSRLGQAQSCQGSEDIQRLPHSGGTRWNE